MIFLGVQNMVRYCIGFLQGIYSGLQALPNDGACAGSGLIHVSAAIFNPGQAVCHSSQGGAIRTDFREMERSQFAVGKDELGRLISIQVDDPLGLVNHISGTLQFSHHISAHGELGEVDGPILRSRIFLRSPGAVHRLNAEFDIGNRFAEVCAVYLDKMDTGQAVIVKYPFHNAHTCGQLRILRGGVYNVFIVSGVSFLDPIAALGLVHQKDFALFIGAENAQGNIIPEDLKGHIRHKFHRLSVILDDPQAWEFFIDDGRGRFLARYHIDRLNGIGHSLPALDSCQLTHFPCTRLQLVEGDGPSGGGLSAPGLAALQVLDLDGYAGKQVAGITLFFHAQGAIGCVPEGQGRYFVVLHIRVLGTLVREKMIPGREFLCHRIVALKGQGDHHGPVRPSGERTNLTALGVIDGEHSSLQGDFCAFLQLYDFQRGLVRVRVLTIVVVADGGHIQPYIIVQVTDIILQVAVFILLLADGIHSGILRHGGGQCKLDAAALVLDGFCGVQHLKLSGIPVPSSFRGNSGHILVVHVDDPGAIGNGGGVLKGNRNVVIVDPCFTPNREYLLIVVLTINTDRIGHGMVRGSRHFGCEHIVVGGASLINILGSSQDAVASVQLRSGEAGGNLQIIDVPAGDQIAPQSHLGGIICLILVV